MSYRLNVYTEQDLAPYLSSRTGEKRIGEALFFINTQVDFDQALLDASHFGIKYVLLGIPEDIGPKANCGQGGAQLGWQAFLSRFANLQSNRHFPAEQVLLLGEIELTDLQKQADSLSPNIPSDLIALRELCSQVDDAVEPVIRAIFNAGLEPIIIGGGHNNCFPIIKALSTSSQNKISAVNLDPHADFRAIEGRHSGNGFHYAYKNQFLANYHVIGLHELKNNEAIYCALEQAGFSYDSYQKIKVRQQITLNKACFNVRQKFEQSLLPVGIEVDVDSISYMPVSAFTNCSFSVSEAEQFVFNMASLKDTRYLHLCEAAPQQHAAGLSQGLNEAGQTLCALVYAYLMARTAIK